MKFKINKFFAINTFILVTVFLISVAIRIDNLKAPAGRHHEWLTGHVLTTLSIFEKNGISYYNFNPVFTFDAKAERDLLKNQVFRDKNLYAYYTSYPPFCFIFPYLAFKLFNLKVSLLGIRIIGLFIHFYCALLIFLIINQFFKKQYNSLLFIPSLIGYTMYLFASGNLWFHANIYFADMLVHVFILSALLVFIKVVDEPQNTNKWHLTGLAFFTFFGVYTEWIAVFFAFFMGAFLFLKAFKNKILFKYVIAIFIAASSSISLSIWQYTTIAGFQPLKEKTIQKYTQRSGHDKSNAEAGYAFGTASSKNRFFTNYETNYSSLLDYTWLIFYVIVLLLFLNYLRRKNTIKQSHFLGFGVVFLSIVTHHLAFFNFTVVHDFSTLKSSILFTLFIGYITGMLFTYYEEKGYLVNSILFGLITFWFVHCSIQNYYFVNKQDKSSYYQKIVGDVIKKYSTPDEVIFTNVYGTPVIWYYAQRNIIESNHIHGCVSFLKSSNSQKGFFVKLIEQDKKFLVSANRLNINGDSTLLLNETINFNNLGKFALDALN